MRERGKGQSEGMGRTDERERESVLFRVGVGNERVNHEIAVNEMSEGVDRV